MSDQEARHLPLQIDADTLADLSITTWMTDAGPFDVLADLQAPRAQASRTRRVTRPGTFAEPERVVTARSLAGHLTRHLLNAIQRDSAGQGAQQGPGQLPHRLRADVQDRLGSQPLSRFARESRDRTRPGGRLDWTSAQVRPCGDLGRETVSGAVCAGSNPAGGAFLNWPPPADLHFRQFGP
jgi:hypothetical protein